MDFDNNNHKNSQKNECKDSHQSSSQQLNESRRNFLCTTAGASAATVVSATGAAALISSGDVNADDFSATHPDPSLDGKNRASIAAKLKIHLAKEQLHESYALQDQLDNNDERRYRNDRYYASFHKSMPQNEYGEVEPQAFRQLRKALRKGRESDFNNIPLSNIAQRPLENPQGALRFEMTGLDSHATRMPPAPKFRSALAAAEMGEVYWQALTRDIPFINYNSSALVGDAVSDLNYFSKTVGPKQSGQVTAQTLFRGETAGDVNGPYISQLLYKDIPYGPSKIVQRYEVGVAGQDFMIDEINWINVQRGANPNETISFENDLRYIHNNRALSEYVHRDVLFQGYFNAALILLGLGPNALDQNNPYLTITNQSPFTSLGGPWLLQILTYASNLALSGAWYQKWRVHRRLRPEVYGGRVHFHQTAGRNYELHSDILNSDAVAKAYSLNGSYFLPMAYTEGSPRHPSYPAGHATVAGACCTVLKAFFNEDFIMPDTVQADASGLSLVPYNDSALTLGGEVNKLANNISIGRDAAGVHYRSDGVDGLVVGEQQAIRLLRDQVKLFNENFAGFTLTKFDGTQITIS